MKLLLYACLFASALSLSGKTIYPAADQASVPWMNIQTEEKAVVTRLFGDGVFEGLGKIIMILLTQITMNSITIPILIRPNIMEKN